MSRIIFVFCASAIFLQCAFSQYVTRGSTVTGNTIVENDIYIGNSGLNLANSGLNLVNNGLNLVNSGLGYGVGTSGLNLVNSGLGYGVGSIGLSGLDIVSSGPLVVTSISPIGPSGIAIASENVIEGVLSVGGQLPYLSAVAFEGALPSAGAGVATCGCGSGNVGIIGEGLPAAVASAGRGRGLIY